MAGNNRNYSYIWKIRKFKKLLNFVVYMYFRPCLRIGYEQYISSFLQKIMVLCCCCKRISKWDYCTLYVFKSLTSYDNQGCDTVVCIVKNYLLKIVLAIQEIINSQIAYYVNSTEQKFMDCPTPEIYKIKCQWIKMIIH